ncbi:MAG TPA: MFS transporter [Bacteroidia bacterium]|nr:MFS transporter [Bacteroidia bacterium]
MIEKGNKKIIHAWTMYDWANSVYSLTITTAVFPIYFSEVTSTTDSDIVRFLGRDFTNTVLYTYALSGAFLLIALLSPLLSAIADSSGSKKGFMKFFCWLGGIACCSLFFFDANTLGIGVAGFMLASIGYSGSIVFYNSYLPEIAEPEDQDRVSARGFAMGYIGSSLLLIFNLIMIMKPEWFGISNPTLPARISFLLVGVWWVGFAAYTFKYLPSNVYNKQRQGDYLTRGYKELRMVWKQLRGHSYLTRFLLSFFFYNMGVQTVMYVATLFGEKELHMETGQLIVTVLIIQFVAIAGAYLFSWASSKLGNIQALAIAIVIWIGICVGAYYTRDVNSFYVLAFIVGMVMGGIQSLSRSTYSKLLPPSEDHASYFSFYDVCDKVGLVLGSASYGLIEELTGSMRNSIISLIAFFIMGMIFLFFILFNNRKPAGTLS